MHRPRILSRWAKVAKVKPETVSLPEELREILRTDRELSTAEMRGWMLRACDRSDYQLWMPHRIVQFRNTVRVYYAKLTNNDTKGVIGKSEHNGQIHTLVLLVSNANITIDEWAGDKLLSSVPASVVATTTKPTIEESMQILET